MSDSPRTSSYSEISLAEDDYTTLFQAALKMETIDEQGTIGGRPWFRSGYLVVFEGEEE